MLRINRRLYLFLPAWKLQLQIMALWHLTISYDLLVVQIGGIVAGSIVMDVELYVLLEGGEVELNGTT